MRGERAGRARRGRVRVGAAAARARATARATPMPPGRSSTGCIAGEGDDRRLDPDGARAAVEYRRHGIAEIVGDVLRRRRRDAAEPVRRGCGDAAAERGEQLARDRMRRHAQADAVLAAGDDVRRRAMRAEGSASAGRARTRPPAFSRLPARCAPSPSFASRRCKWTITGWSAGRPFAAKMRRTASGLRGIGAEAVDRLGRKRDQHAGAQPIGGAGDRGGCRRVDGRAHGLSTTRRRGPRAARGRRARSILLESKLSCGVR